MGYKGNPQLNRNVDCDVVVAEVVIFPQHVAELGSCCFLQEGGKAELWSR